MGAALNPPATAKRERLRSHRQPAQQGSRYGHMCSRSGRLAYNSRPIIRRVTAIETRELKPDDWPVWRKLRQSALAEAPQVFGSALADWTGAGDTEQRWLARLRDVPVNLVIALDGEPAGMVSITAPDAGGTVEMISMWVAPEARGRGVGDKAVRQAITRAAQRFPELRHDAVRENG